MAIKQGRGVTLAPKKWRLGWIFLLAAVAAFTFSVVNRQVNPHQKHTQTTVKAQPVIKPTPTQPTQTFSAKPVSIGEAMLGSYWEKGKLYYNGLYGLYSLLFTLPQGAELRTPFPGTIALAPSGNTNSSNGVAIFPAPSLFQEGAGNYVFYGGDSLKLMVTNGEAVSAGEVIAIVTNPAVVVVARGNNLTGNVIVGYGATTSSEPHTYTFVSKGVLEDAFPYVKDLVPGQ